MKERMDENHVEIFGIVTKIWKRDRHIFARLITKSAEEDEHPPRFTLKFPDGKFDGDGITLMAGDKLKITGWICDEPYLESINDFIARSKYPIRLDAHLNLHGLEEIAVKRSITAVVPETCEMMGNDLELNFVSLEGIVARTWEHKSDKFIRLAVYHANAQTTETEGNHGHPRRVPHYVTVQFSNGIVDGRIINIQSKRHLADDPGIAPRDRVIVTGTIAESFYSESLHSFLLDAKRIDVLDRMPDSSEVANIWSSYSQTVILARKLVHYT